MAKWERHYSTHARTRARTQARTHARTHARTGNNICRYRYSSNPCALRQFYDLLWGSSQADHSRMPVRKIFLELHSVNSQRNEENDMVKMFESTCTGPSRSGSMVMNTGSTRPVVSLSRSVKWQRRFLLFHSNKTSATRNIDPKIPRVVMISAIRISSFGQMSGQYVNPKYMNIHFPRKSWLFLGWQTGTYSHFNVNHTTYRVAAKMLQNLAMMIN
jgi:hypothetical protein